MILVLTAPDHDYHADYLTHGFVALRGPGVVVDYPRKPSLHGGPVVMDCDMDIETVPMSREQVETALRNGAFKLVVIPTLRGGVPAQVQAWRELLRRNADRVVFVDGEDDSGNREPVVRELLGFRPVAHFKRELPYNETWARPLPFGYPAERVVPVDGAVREGAVLYAVEIWPWARGRLRERLADMLRGTGATVHTTYDGEGRWSVQEYHEQNRKHLVAVSPAGAGYFTNRHFDIIADGCCPVLERPWRQFPMAFIGGVHCEYFRDEFEAADAVTRLVADREYAIAMAQAAQAWLLEHHTTKARAKTVWDSVHA